MKNPNIHSTELISVQFKILGDILAFSNIRLQHGRTGYEDTEGDVRHLIGAYLDWDEIYSRLRILANEINTQEK